MRSPLKDLWEILVANKNSTEDEIKLKMEEYAKNSGIEPWLLERYMDILGEIALEVALSYHDEC